MRTVPDFAASLVSLAVARRVVDLLGHALAQRVELRVDRRLQIDDLAGQRRELRQPPALRVLRGGRRHVVELLLELRDARQHGRIVGARGGLRVDGLDAAGKLVLALRQAIDAAADLLEALDLGLGRSEP